MTESKNERQAKALGTSPDQIGHLKDKFRNEAFGGYVLAIQKDELEQQIKERQQKLESVEPENLKKVQGEITGLRLAISTIALKP